MLKRTAFFTVLLSFVVSSLCAQGHTMTIRPEPPTSIPMLGIPFGANFIEASRSFADLGLELARKRAFDTNNLVYLLTYSSLPPSVGVEEGHLDVLFFKNRLVRVDFVLDPTYANFLLTRNQLFEQLGSRYTVEKENTVMDKMLQAHLAGLDKDSLDADIEQQISDSVKEGKTFYYYRIKDSKQQFNVSLAYFGVQQKNGERAPRLQVHFSLANEMEEFGKYKELLRDAEKSRR